MTDQSSTQSLSRPLLLANLEPGDRLVFRQRDSFYEDADFLTVVKITRTDAVEVHFAAGKCRDKDFHLHVCIDADYPPLMYSTGHFIVETPVHMLNTGDILAEPSDEIPRWIVRSRDLEGVELEDVDHPRRNRFHRYGTFVSSDEWHILAKRPDGTVRRRIEPPSSVSGEPLSCHICGGKGSYAGFLGLWMPCYSCGPN